MSAQPGIGGERREALRFVKAVLDLSARGLTQEPDQLAGQLTGRLFTSRSPAVTRLLRTAAAEAGSPWLRPVSASLTNPCGPLLHPLIGHTRDVWDLAVTPDGLRVLSASRDGTVRVWEVETGLHLATLVGHTDEVWSVAVTPDGARAVSASKDRTLRVWDLSTFGCLHTLPGHADGVALVVATPDGRHAVSVSNDRTLRLWDLDAAKETVVLDLAAEPEGGMVLTPDGRRAVCGTADHAVGVWELETGTQEAMLAGHEEGLTSIVVSPDGRRVVSASKDCDLRVWDLERAECVAVMQDRLTPWAIAVTPDGRKLISAVSEGMPWRSRYQLSVWDLATATRAATLEGHTDWIFAIAVTPDGGHVVSASDDLTVRVWDLSACEEVARCVGHTQPPARVIVTPDGRRAISAPANLGEGPPDTNLMVWDLGHRGASPPFHSARVTAIAVTPDGRHAMSGSKDGTLALWDLHLGARVAAFVGHRRDRRPEPVVVSDDPYPGTVVPQGGGPFAVTALAATPDGRRVISASQDAHLKVWDLASRSEIATLRGHRFTINALAITRDGRRAVSGCEDGDVRVWDLDLLTEQAPTVPVERTEVGPSASLATPKGLASLFHGSVHAVAITPDGRRAVIGCGDAAVRVWDLDTVSELAVMEGHTDAVVALALTPDGRRAISGSHDGSVRVWELRSFALLSSFVGFFDSVEMVAAMPDGRRVLSVSGNTLMVWDLSTGEMTTTMRSGTAVIRALAVTADGRAVTADSGGTISQWDVSSGERQASLTTDVEPTSCAVTADARVIAVGDRMGRVHIVRIEGVASLDDGSRERTTRNEPGPDAPEGRPGR